jgi:hypothetical protein
MRTRKIPPFLLLLAAFAACEPPDQPAPAPGGGGADGGGGNTGGGGNNGGNPGGGGGGSPGSGDGTSTLALAFERHGTRQDVSRVDLEVVGLSLFVGTSPRYANDNTPCDAGVAGALADLRTTVSLDARSEGETPLASVDVSRGGQLRELWLVLRRGTAVREGREYKVHAGALCVMPDGLQYTLVRLRPGEPVQLGGPDHRILVTFDPRDALVIDRIRCDDSSGPGGGGSGDDECRSADDDHDDDRGDTRLRFSLPRSLPVHAEPAG